MPGYSGVGDLGLAQAQTQVLAASVVEAVQRHHDLGRLAEGLVEVDSTRVLRARLVPGPHVLGVELAACYTRLVSRVGEPGDACAVEDGVGPGVGMHGEAVVVDVGGVDADAPGARAVHVELLQEGDDLGRAAEGLGEIDARTLRELRVVPGARLLCVVRARLEVVEARVAALEPGERGRAEHCVGPAFEGCLELLLGDVAGEGADADVGLLVNVQGREGSCGAPLYFL